MLKSGRYSLRIYPRMAARRLSQQEMGTTVHLERRHEATLTMDWSADTLDRGGSS